MHLNLGSILMGSADARPDHVALQFGLAMTHYERMRAPQRDQTETRAALAEFQRFFDRYPNSPVMPEARERWREARDRLSESIYLVGRFYYNQNWMPGAVDRFEQILGRRAVLR